MAEPIDYQAVLADLVARRDQLNAAIAAIEQVAGVGGATNTNKAAEEIRSDTFFGLSVPMATKKYLGMTGRQPKSPQEIVAALDAGGCVNATYSNVYTALKRLRTAGEVHKLPNGEWGLAEWYPGARVPKRGKSSEEGEELGDEGDEAADPNIGRDTA